MGYPQMDGLQWKILSTWMIWRYPYFRKPLYIHSNNVYLATSVANPRLIYTACLHFRYLGQSQFQSDTKINYWQVHQQFAIGHRTFKADLPFKYLLQLKLAENQKLGFWNHQETNGRYSSLYLQKQIQSFAQFQPADSCFKPFKC